MAVAAYWLWALCSVWAAPAPSGENALLLMTVGLPCVLCWIVRNGIWSVEVLRLRRRFIRREWVLAIAPAAMAVVSFLLVSFEIPFHMHFALAKPSLTRYATVVAGATPGSRFTSCRIAGFSLNGVKVASGGILCADGTIGTVHTWGFAHFPPPLSPPGHLYCVPLGDGWYYWRD